MPLNVGGVGGLERLQSQMSPAVRRLDGFAGQRAEGFCRHDQRESFGVCGKQVAFAGADVAVLAGGATAAYVQGIVPVPSGSFQECV